MMDHSTDKVFYEEVSDERPLLCIRFHCTVHITFVRSGIFTDLTLLHILKTR